MRGKFPRPTRPISYVDPFGLTKISGDASFYALSFEGQPTHSNEIFHHANMTAAMHPEVYPPGHQIFDSRKGHRKEYIIKPFDVKVKSTKYCKEITVRVNDNGLPASCLIDLTTTAFKALGAPLSEGLTPVEVTIPDQ